jgi:hypothetical protein
MASVLAVLFVVAGVAGFVAGGRSREPGQLGARRGCAFTGVVGAVAVAFLAAATAEATVMPEGMPLIIDVTTLVVVYTGAVGTCAAMVALGRRLSENARHDGWRKAGVVGSCVVVAVACAASPALGALAKKQKFTAVAPAIMDGRRGGVGLTAAAPIPLGDTEQVSNGGLALRVTPTSSGIPLEERAGQLVVAVTVTNRNRYASLNFESSVAVTLRRDTAVALSEPCAAAADPLEQPIPPSGHRAGHICFPAGPATKLVLVTVPVETPNVDADRRFFAMA